MSKQDCRAKCMLKLKKKNLSEGLNHRKLYCTVFK